MTRMDHRAQKHALFRTSFLTEATTQRGIEQRTAGEGHGAPRLPLGSPPSEHVGLFLHPEAP